LGRKQNGRSGWLRARLLAGSECIEAYIPVGNTRTYAEMTAPATEALLGNLPEVLTHLALIQSATTPLGTDQ